MPARDQLERLARQWGVSIVDVRETQGSVLGFGERGDQQVVLKITKQRGDEWRSGDVLRAFDGGFPGQFLRQSDEQRQRAQHRE